MLIRRALTSKSTRSSTSPSCPLGHKEHLGDVVAGYGTDVDRDLIRAWWSLRCLTSVRWLAEHGYGSPRDFPEVAVLRSQM
jgi:hypothetical protein